MAILVVWIEDASTLLMNEFFDYNGRCYALTRSRKENTDVCINLEDFYEGTVQSESLEDIPVVFVKAQDGGWAVIGYYKRAEVRKKIMRPSLFLEGNIRADVREAWLFSEDERKQIFAAHFGERYYEVVEDDDARYQPLMACMTDNPGQNSLLRYDCVDIFLQSTIRNQYEACLAECERLASALMCELGRVRQGMKAIEKALRIEPEGADLMALKGQLLVSMGKTDAAAQWFHKAWYESGDDDYLMLEGRAWLLDEKPDDALDCFKKISDKGLLDAAGINLKDMEQRWPPVSARGVRG